MHFTYSLPLLLASTALAAPWSGDLLQPNTPVGGNTGSPFSLVAEEGAMIKTLRFWRDSSDDGRPFIRGVELTFTDNKKASTGKPEKQPKEFAFEPDEVITQMSLWGDGIGTKTGRIYFKTNKGREYLHGRDQPEAHQTEFPMEVGSGILVGFSGQSGEDVDHIAPVFLKQLKKDRRIEDLEFEKFDLATEGLKLETLDEAEFQFPADGKEHVGEFGRTVIRTVSLSLEDSVAETISAGVTIGGEIPQLASVEFSASWELTQAQTNTQSFTRDEPLTWKLAVPLKTPEDACRCIAQVFMGTLDLSYTGTLVLETVDSGTFKIPTSGRLKKVQASKVVTNCRLLSNGQPAPNVQSLPSDSGNAAAELVQDATVLAAAPAAEPAAAVKRQVLRLPRRGLGFAA
ncbi:hypothetical protein QBC44DRAFT_243627 [Cladorrhinum sp. PSN332]|nr:hypothetical protein QBC44DRAFT_243627 [Cladorrhinum sp. PSN332]